MANVKSVVVCEGSCDVSLDRLPYSSIPFDCCRGADAFLSQVPVSVITEVVSPARTLYISLALTRDYNVTV